MKENFIVFYIYNTAATVLQVGVPCAFAQFWTTIAGMDESNEQEVLDEFGKRVQRCFGCFVAYHLKDMYLGEEASFYCDYCKDDTMFHFSEFSKMVDAEKLREAENDHHH